MRRCLSVIFVQKIKVILLRPRCRILDKSRTIVPFGSFKHLHNDVEPCSIDRGNVFSKAGSGIVKVPVFKEFDVWKPYGDKADVNRFGDYTLYLVKACHGNIFLNNK